MKFTIDGAPTGKARPRVVNRHAFTPEKTVLYENLVKICYQQAGGTYSEKPLLMRIVAVYDIPKSASRKAAEQMRGGEIRPCKKPDIDNVCKVILDALNGVAYKDDTQVVELNIVKQYGEQARVEVEIDEVSK